MGTWRLPPSWKRLLGDWGKPDSQVEGEWECAPGLERMKGPREWGERWSPGGCSPPGGGGQGQKERGRGSLN